MDDNILDFEEEKNKIPIHANKSFNQFLFSLLFSFLTIIVSFFTFGFFQLFHGTMMVVLVRLFMLIPAYFSIMGLKNGIKSFKTDEKSKFKKLIGITGNLLLTMIWMVFFCYLLLLFFK